MAWTAPANPVAGTVITVAWAITNVTDNLRWLRLMTGNADPPGSSYIPLSTGPTTVAWSKVTADALAAGVAVSNIGYTPVNRAGDAGITGTLQTTGALVSTNIGANAIQTNGGIHADQSITAGGSVSATGNVTAGGDVNGSRLAASFSGPNALVVAGDGSINGAVVVTGRITGNGGFGPITSNGAISTTAGVSATGNVVTSTGAFIAQVATGTAPLQVNSTSLVANLNVQLLNGHNAGHASGEIPIADGTLCANLNAELLGGQPRAYYESLATGGTGATIPAGMIAAFATAAEIPTGWSRYTAADGRLLVGAGQAIAGETTFVENNAYGSSWGHRHAANSFGFSTSLSGGAASVSGSLSGSATGGASDQTGTSSDINGLAQTGGVNLNTTGHRHSLNGVSFAASVSGTLTGSASGTVAGSATGDSTTTTLILPSRAVVWARKN